MTDQVPGHSTFGEREQEMRRQHPGQPGPWTTCLACHLVDLLDREREENRRLVEVMDRRLERWETEKTELLEALEERIRDEEEAERIASDRDEALARIFEERKLALDDFRRALLAKHEEQG